MISADRGKAIYLKNSYSTPHQGLHLGDVEMQAKRMNRQAGGGRPFTTFSLYIRWGKWLIREMKRTDKLTPVKRSIDLN